VGYNIYIANLQPIIPDILIYLLFPLFENMRLNKLTIQFPSHSGVHIFPFYPQKMNPRNRLEKKRKNGKITNMKVKEKKENGEKKN